MLNIIYLNYCITDLVTINVAENYFLIICLLIFFYTVHISLLFNVLNCLMIAFSSIQIQL